MPEGVPLKVTVTVDPDQGMIEVDLRDNLDCQPCGLNLTEATARTAAMMGIFSGLGEVVPPNAGSFRRLRVHLRENCVVGIPRHPTSCSAATTDLSELERRAAWSVRDRRTRRGCRHSRRSVARSPHRWA